VVPGPQDADVLGRAIGPEPRQLVDVTVCGNELVLHPVDPLSHIVIVTTIF
jgi:hypothetical protein